MGKVIENNFLETMGFDQFFEDQWNSLPEFYSNESIVPARVSSCHGQRLDAITNAGKVSAYLARESLAPQPVVGDWILVEMQPQEYDATSLNKAVHLFNRKTELMRQDIAQDGKAQALAANVDHAWITASANAELNISRIERYLTICEQGGVNASIVLTKTDLSENLGKIRAAFQRRLAWVPLFATSCVTGDGIAELLQLLLPGNTYVLLGSSGVGKTTIRNQLLANDEHVGKTAAIRESDSKGRHTTTNRELVAAKSGAWLIDTPGMRALAVWNGDEAIVSHFSDIAEMAKDCFYRNCHHQSEDRCAVKQAVDQGTLDANRLANFLKLKAEYRYKKPAMDAAPIANSKKRWKGITQQVRAQKKEKY